MSKNPSITETLMQIRDGGALEELGDQLRTLVKQVQLSGKPGALTLTLKVSPNGNRMVMVKDTIKVVEPKVENPDSLFFVGDVGELLRKDPLQPEFNELREAK